MHISKICHERVEKVEDKLNIGDTIKVKVMEIDDRGRVNVSAKALLPRPKKEEKQLVKKDEVPAEETVETKKEETPAVES